MITMTKKQNLIEFIFKSYQCPYFRDPPVSDGDLEFISPYWMICDYEDICLEIDNCPVLKQRYPKFKEKEE